MQAWQLVVVGLVSFAVAALLVATRGWHVRWTGDFEDSGVQKHHVGSPPRVGIVPLMSAVLAGLYFIGDGAAAQGTASYRLLLGIVLASLPVVLLGLADDLTKKVPPKVRLAGAAAAGALGMVLFDNFVTRVNIPGVDTLVQFGPLAVALTLLMVSGFTNAMNIVDGLNGLSTGLAVLMLCATGFVAASVGDSVVVNLCMVLGVAIVGFMLVNFPRGLMFLGDGAAYFIGFALAQIWMLLLARNTEISTWFVVAVAAHPTMETVFSMYRRRVYGRRGGAFTAADRLHLHSLVYRRRTLALVHRMPWLPRWAPNALAACMVMGIALLPMLAASAAPNSSAWCAGVAAASAFGYVLCFRHLIGFGSIRRRAVPAVQSGLVSTASPQ